MQSKLWVSEEGCMQESINSRAAVVPTKPQRSHLANSPFMGTMNMYKIYPAAVCRLVLVSIVFGFGFLSQPTALFAAPPAPTFTKSDGGSPAVSPGDTITYTLGYSHISAVVDPLTNVTITETVPANTKFVGPDSDWSCSANDPAGTSCVHLLASDLMTGTSGSVQFQVAVVDPLPVGVVQINNTASIGASNIPTVTQASDDTPVVAAANLQVSKSADVASVSHGDTIIYTVVYTNAGNQDASGVILTETLPDNTTYDGPTTGPNSWSCSASSCDYSVVGTLAGNNGSGSVDFRVKASATLPPTVTAITNTVKIGVSGDLNQDQKTISTPVLTPANLSVTKSDSGATATPGGIVTYQISYENLGNQTAANVVLEERVPDYTSPPGSPWDCSALPLCTQTFLTLAGGAQGSATFQVTVDGSVPAAVVQLSNTVKIGDGGIADDDVHTINTPLIASPILDLSKSASAGSVQPGETVTYTLTYDNNGNQTATSVVLTETVPPHTTFVGPAAWVCGGAAAGSICTYQAGDLNGGASNTIDFAVQVVNPVPAGANKIVNDAGMGAGNAAAVQATHQAVTIDATPALAISKVADVTTIVPDNIIIYTLNYTNTGNQAATSVVLHETLPGQTGYRPFFSTSGWNCISGDCTFDVGPVAGGASGSVDFGIKLVAPVSANLTQISNQARISAVDAADALSNVVNTPVDAQAVLSISKSASSGSIQPNGTIVYTLQYRNTGNREALNVVLEETVPAYTTFVGANSWICDGSPVAGTVCRYNAGSLSGNMAIDETVTFTVKVNNPLPAGANNVQNQASIRGTGIADTSSNTVNTTINAAPDLTIDKYDDGMDVAAGYVIVYTLDYANDGNQDATGVVITEIVPLRGRFRTTSSSAGWSCSDSADPGDACTYTIGNLASGASGSVLFAVRSPAKLSAATYTIENTASIADDGSNGSDQNGNDNSATDTTVVVGEAELVATKIDSLEDDPDNNNTFSPGDTILYTIVVSNTGTAPADNVKFVDSIDANVTLQTGSVSKTQGQITEGDNANDTSVEVLIGQILPGSGATITFKVKIDTPLPAGISKITNQGQISATGLPQIVTDDPDTPIPNDSTNTSLEAQPEISAILSDEILFDNNDDGIANPGDILKYTVTIVNSGSQAATGVVFRNTPDQHTRLEPTGTTADRGNITRGDEAGDTDIRINIGTMAGGGDTVTIEFQTTIRSPLPAGVTSVENQGIVQLDDYPATQTDDPATGRLNDATITSLTTSPELDVTKEDILVFDADDDGVPSPGDTLGYNVKIVNVGNQAVTDVKFLDTPDALSKLLTDSISTDHGSIASGDSEGDTFVQIDVGNIAGAGGTVTISFEVKIPDTVPAGVNQITNQGVVESNELPTEFTDDPDTQPASDPTVTTITAVPIVSASKEDELLLDANSDLVPSPGDTIEYRITIANNGNQTALGVRFSDPINTNATLVANSVGVSAGTVTSGNDPTDTSVTVEIGAIPPRGNIVVTFAVIVKPLLPGVNSLSNQGTVDGENFTAIRTDDPDTAVENDPTITPLTAAPALGATKRSSLFDDADQDGVPSPGDTLLYEITIVNSGNSAATQVEFSDQPDSNTTLVVGSVSNSQGAINSGNTQGETTVEVEVGTILGSGNSVTISYQATVNDPLPVDVVQIQNQGIVTSNELPVVSTDDPTTDPVGDPTITALSTSPILAASQTATLLIDADEDGAPSPGDTLVVEVKIRNSGNGVATGIRFLTNIDPNSLVVPGSIQSSQGIITKNGVPDNDEIKIEIGTIAAGNGNATISYQLQIGNPLPANVAAVTIQGRVNSDQLGEILTDDPEADGAENATEISVVAAPLVRVTLSDLLFIDADSDQSVSAGDTLFYRVTIKNSGNGPATGIVFENTPDPNTTLIVGTVQASQGIIVAGNNGNERRALVDVGVLAGGGGSVTISLQVRVNDSIPVSELHNQAILRLDSPIASGAQLVIESDDPDTKESADSTTTPISSVTVQKNYLPLVQR